MKRIVYILLSVFFLLTTQSVLAQTKSVQVRVTNITHGSYFSPMIIAAHERAVRMFEAGTAASPELQALAECGEIDQLSMLLGDVAIDAVEDPAGGELGPGETADTTLTIQLNDNDEDNGEIEETVEDLQDPSETNATLPVLSLVARLMPTNDGFVGMDSQQLPQNGTMVVYLNAYDAGTENNDEIVTENACVVGEQGIPPYPGENTGTDATGIDAQDPNTTVHIHPGIIGDLDPEGGISDLSTSAHKWNNPVARVEITVSDTDDPDEIDDNDDNDDNGGQQ
jgi:hypothetical protein